MKSKNKILAIIMVILCIVIAIGVITLVNQNTLKQTSNIHMHETGEELVTAPKVEFAHRYVFTNDIEHTSFEGVFVSVADTSEWSAKLVRFEYKENLQVMDENGLKRLTDTIPLPGYKEELKAIGTTDIPTEEGIYRAVLEITDVQGNNTLEEVYVIYDTTGARIDDTPDKTIEVIKEDLDKEPKVDKTDYIIIDNADGVIAAENINCELDLRDAEKHEWLVHVSYTDRAGNESKAEFLIIVKEGASADVDDDTETDKNNADNEDADDKTTNNDTTNNAGSSDDKEYDPADTNKDGFVDENESLEYISPTKQKIIDAGVGNVVKLDDTTYALCVPDPDYLVNGKRGNELLREYLADLGLEPTSLSGGWMTLDYYCFSATNVHEIDTSGLEWSDDTTFELYE